MSQNGSGNGHGNGQVNGNGNGGCVGANLAFTKFLFVIARQDDDAGGTRLRTAGGNVARGFFNDFDIDDSRESQAQPFETIQFFVRDGEMPTPAPTCAGPCINKARYLVQVCSKYRPRLQEIDEELRRRLGETADVLSLAGAVRNPRYSSPEMVQYANKNAPTRRSGRVARNAIIVPVRKTEAWWEMTALERHTYFYPHVDRASGCPVKGHARAAEPGISTLFRRMYHNPDGYQVPNEYDFITYFECEDEQLPVFDRVLANLRDPQQNPEWQYVQEGPIWRGKRVLRW
jgi:hypothetical protein